MSYLGAAANVIGGELQGWAAVLARQNMFDEFQRQQRQQQAFGDMGEGIFRESLGNYGAGAAERDLAQGKADRMKSYRDVEDTPLGFNAPGQKGFATDTGYGRLLGSNRAGLGSYSDFALKQALASNNTQRLLNQLASSAGGSASIYPYYMYGAQHSMDDLAAIGAAISSIGGGAANYAQIYGQGPQQAPAGQVGLGIDPTLWNRNYWTPGAGSNVGWDY